MLASPGMHDGIDQFVSGALLGHRRRPAHQTHRGRRWRRLGLMMRHGLWDMSVEAAASGSITFSEAVPDHGSDRRNSLPVLELVDPGGREAHASPIRRP